MNFAQRIDNAAWNALVFELTLAPKPGLVTPFCTGSHRDMDHRHFSASIEALAGYFGDCARLGASGAALRELQTRGLIAEAAMFAATGGVNTHKGAVFTLGLLAAATGVQHARGVLRPEQLGHVVAEEWGNALLDAAEVAPSTTHGLHVRRTLGLPGAREQAGNGFPVLFETTLPALREGRQRLGNDPRALLHALIATIAVLPDSNLAHRGGRSGLEWARMVAADFIAAGSVFETGAERRLQALCGAFKRRWLSPGGSADLLAAALFVQTLATDHFVAHPAEAATA
ncbi:MAG: triphosphoribosyl-dephospho-CoA synthase [Pseudazoarcus pumilus]|nr:triphosphoribosyl-dephospho-CoA synthase [Pseudazoarcus pumilus]